MGIGDGMGKGVRIRCKGEKQAEEEEIEDRFTLFEIMNEICLCGLFWFF